MCVSNMLSFANSLQTHKYCQSCPVLKGVHWTNSNSASMALRHRMYPLEICAVVSWQSMQNLLRCFSFWSKWSPTRHCQPETQTAKTRRITFLCWSECIPSVWKNQEQKKKTRVMVGRENHLLHSSVCDRAAVVRIICVASLCKVTSGSLSRTSPMMSLTKPRSTNLQLEWQ